MLKISHALCGVVVSTIFLIGCGSSPTEPEPSDSARNNDAPEDWIWISPSEIQSLPMTGPAWDQVWEAANRPTDPPNVSDKEQRNNIDVLAKAFVYVRTGDESYRDEVRANCLAAIGTEVGGRTLALGRELLAYIIAAELVGLTHGEDIHFRIWLRNCLTADLQGRTLQSTHETKPNNWGLGAGASRAAIALYTDDDDELDRTVSVLKGWLGDSDAHDDFEYGSLSWQADPTSPVGINPHGTLRAGLDVSGAMPDEMRRGGDYALPPGVTNYPWAAMQGLIALAEILWRQGHDVYEWENYAIARAVGFLRRLHVQSPESGWWAVGNDEWVVWIVNARYGTNYAAELPARPGKNMGWTDWTHATPSASRGFAPLSDELRRWGLDPPFHPGGKKDPPTLDLPGRP